MRPVLCVCVNSCLQGVRVHLDVCVDASEPLERFKHLGNGSLQGIL